MQIMAKCWYMWGSRRGDNGIRTHDEGFADPCLTTWLRGHIWRASRLLPGLYPPLTELGDLAVICVGAEGFEPPTCRM